MNVKIAPSILSADFGRINEEIKEVEEFVNEAVSDGVDVSKKEMVFEDAIKSGALAFFKQKYPETVNVYSIGDVSKELCGGPHVSNTKEIGKFRIIKEIGRAHV